jgi:hypothetical protein
VESHTPPARSDRSPRAREPERGSVWLMLGFAGAATAVFFVVLGLIGLAFLAYMCYLAYSYYR